MTNPNLGRPQLSPELIDVFEAYHRDHPTWGSLHIVLNDGNYNNDSVQFCIEWAKRNNDKDGLALAIILKGMTRTQRARIAARVHAREWERRREPAPAGPEEGAAGAGQEKGHPPERAPASPGTSR